MEMRNTLSKRLILLNELEDRDELFKIYYSERMKRSLQIQRDCDEITYKEVDARLKYYQRKRQYWGVCPGRQPQRVQLEAIQYNTTFLPPEQVKQAEQQTRYNQARQHAEQKLEYAPSSGGRGAFRRKSERSKRPSKGLLKIPPSVIGTQQ